MNMPEIQNIRFKKQGRNVSVSFSVDEQYLSVILPRPWIQEINPIDPITNMIESPRSDSDSQKLFKHFYANNGDDMELQFTSEPNFRCKKNNDLESIIVSHDPLPHQFLYLNLFNSLESIQWHLLKHGFIDLYTKPNIPSIISGLINQDLQKKMWTDFVETIQCPRWGFDFENDTDAIKKYFEAEKNFQPINFNDASLTRAHGCFNCIKNNSIELFIKCYDFWKKIRVAYLRRIKNWVIQTMKDHQNLAFYNGEILKEACPKRKHVHLDYLTCVNQIGQLKAYVIFQSPNSRLLEIFVMIFQRFFRHHKFNRPENKWHYQLKTAYGIGREKCIEDAHLRIDEHLLQKVKKRVIKCHPSNWDTSMKNFSCSGIIVTED
jgi:hypothetical protein